MAHPRSLCSFAVASLLAGCIFTTQAHPLSTIHPPTSHHPKENQPWKRDETCGFTGNPDVYGPGIRIGIYTQTLAVFTTKYFILSQAHVLRDSLTVFSIALGIVAIMLAVSASQTYAVEYFIILQILSWNCLTGVRARNTYSSTSLRNRELRTLGMECMNICALGLHCWFWWRGIEGMGDTECGSKVFFFAETKLLGWFRDVMKGMSLLGLGDHVWDLAWRVARMWACGLGRGEEKELGVSVERFEEWKNGRGGDIEIEEREEKEEDLIITPEPGEDTTEEAGAIEAVSTASSTWNTVSTCADEESISVKILRIRSGLPNPTGRPPSPELEAEAHYPSIQTKECPEIQYFEDVHNADLFLNHCISASSAASLQAHHPQLYKFLLRLCLVPRPLKREHSASIHPSSRKSSPYTTCLKEMAKAIVTLRFPRHAVILLTHLKSARTLDLINGVYQLHAALTYPSSYSPIPSLPHPSIIALSSRLQLSKLPPPPPRVKWTQAAIDFTIHIFVILQIELTIRWNGIRGLGGVGNVGQLIPLLVGVGGLGLVLGRGIEEVCRGEKTWEAEEQQESSEFLGAFEEWKEVIKGARNE